MSTTEGREEQCKETRGTSEPREGVEEDAAPTPRSVHRFLTRFFRRRPPASELAARNVLVESPDVDPCLHAQRRAARRTRTADLLSQRLSVRATREELVLRGILPSAAPSAFAVRGTPREGAVFGLTPAQLAARYPAMEGGVPAVLWACAECILADVETEGLFRVPGTQREVVELRGLVEGGCAVDVRAASTVHVLTSFVGAFFRALPEPLLGFDLYDGWLALARRTKDAAQAASAAASTASTADTAPETLGEIGDMLGRLPRANYVLLRWLLELLHLITLCSAANRMGARGMGTVFGPTLLRPRVETLETLALASLHALVVETLVQHYVALFPHDPAEQPPAVLPSTKYPLPAPLVGLYTPPGPLPKTAHGGGAKNGEPAAPQEHKKATTTTTEHTPSTTPSTTPLVPRRPAPAPPPPPARHDVATQTDFPWLEVLYAHLHRARTPREAQPPRPYPQPRTHAPAPVLPQPVLPQRRPVHAPPPRPPRPQHRVYGRDAQRSAPRQQVPGDVKSVSE